MLARTLDRSRDSRAWAQGDRSTHRAAGALAMMRAGSPPGSDNGRGEQRERALRRQSLGCANHAPASGLAVHGGAHGGPGIRVAERRVGAAAQRDASVDETLAAVEMVVIRRGDVGQVLLAALGNEVRLCDDG